LRLVDPPPDQEAPMPSRSVASSRSTTTPTTGTSRVRKSTLVSTRTGLASAPSHEAIALRAHELFVQSGSQGGRELEFWLEAERQLKGGMQLS
jgi:hypothetical protein